MYLRTVDKIDTPERILIHTNLEKYWSWTASMDTPSPIWSLVVSAAATVAYGNDANANSTSIFQRPVLYLKNL